VKREFRGDMKKVDDFAVAFGLTTWNEAAVGLDLRFGGVETTYAFTTTEARELADLLREAADRADAEGSN
jgi:preprotein translocase subunit SecD